MEELTTLLAKLKMEHLESQLSALCEQAAQRDLDYQAFLVEALRTEWQGRFQRGVETRLRQSRFPWIKTLDQFDFAFQPSLDRRQVRELAGLSFIERAENIVVLGPPGVGKTHLSVALGVKAVEAGYSVVFHTLETLMTRLTRAQHENRLEATLKQLTYPKLLILDELGYLPLSALEASLFFRLVVRRYERGSVILTSNKSFVDWAEIFAGDHALATALLDRLLHHATTLNIKGESYRLKEKRRAGVLGRAKPVPSTDETTVETVPDMELAKGVDHA